MVKEFKNTGYWAVILGGSSGLGLASAKKLAAHGMNIIIVHRNPRVEMEAIEAEFEAIRSYDVDFMAFNTDALNAEKRGEIISGIKNITGDGAVRCLLHSIAKGNLKAMAGDDALQNTDLQITLNAMAFSLYDWVKVLVDENLFAKDARIISFTSEGSSRAWQHYAAVSAAKAALEAITRNIALEFAPFGLRANCIMAGVTDTPSLRMIPGHDELAAYAIKRNPFKMLTKPEDVANAVYLLCKEEAAWITGAVIPVNGGEHLQ
ncbi:short-chain dehydrogenase [Flavobacterium cyanobacteriorum]|uniref:Short-chain dehydrogenase n=1 Tax=Flavobacterium cyanobacteriorum TaxID=2022802 RepID=A0A255ZBP3_9FLAO|nr:SDR family oxidoreductase [Flavobacterium cyanobacteriorum]OYQ38295.1 short-chain dehydrogenase [Flavobacterium cyanobacteriorum]